jgi:hypothetical protein
MNDVIEYFCSYGKAPDFPIKHWANDEFRHVPLKLTSLLDNTELQVVYNVLCFQDIKNKNIATCGGYCAMRILSMLEFNATMGQFNILLQELKTENPKLSYDDIVTQYINYR